jgi:hypothetical protein
MYADEIISMIDGPMLKEQRRAVLQLLCDNSTITPEQSEALEGLTNLLDEIADCAHDVYGKDCLFTDPELERKAEENQYEQRIQTYNH